VRGGGGGCAGGRCVGVNFPERSRTGPSRVERAVAGLLLGLIVGDEANALV